MTSNTVKNTFLGRVNYGSLNPAVTSGTTLGLQQKGDMLVHNGTDAVRISTTTDAFVLTADSSQPLGVRWGAKSNLTAKGDLWVYQNSGGVFDTKLAVGADYTLLMPDSNATKGIKWASLDYRYGVATANQTISNNTYTAVTFGTQVGAAGLTPGSGLAGAGTYMIWLQTAWSNNSTGSRYVEITVDGTRVIGTELAAQASAFTTQTASRMISLNAGQVINFRVKQTSGGNLDLVNNPDLITPGITYYILRLPS